MARESGNLIFWNTSKSGTSANAAGENENRVSGGPVLRGMMVKPAPHTYSKNTQLFPKHRHHPVSAISLRKRDRLWSMRPIAIKDNNNFVGDYHTSFRRKT
jgi:hypothetical protein